MGVGIVMDLHGSVVVNIDQDIYHYTDMLKNHDRFFKAYVVVGRVKSLYNPMVVGIF